LLIEVARLDRRRQRDARLLQGNLRVANIDGGVIYELAL
jgi:hypothetical protein